MKPYTCSQVIVAGVTKWQVQRTQTPPAVEWVPSPFDSKEECEAEVARLNAAEGQGD